MSEVTAIAATRPNPWETVGTSVEGAMTAQEALRRGGLDWTVEKRPLKVDWGHAARPQYTKVPDRVALVRPDTKEALGFVSPTYQAWPNAQCFEFFDNLVDSNEAKYHASGEFRGGRWVWITARVAQLDVNVGGVDPHQTYMHLTTSHDGSRAITVSLSKIRIMCENTFNMAVAGALQKWSVRHIETAKARLEEARQALKLTFKYADAFEKEAEALLSVAMTEKEFEEFANELLPDRPRKASTVELLTRTFAESSTLENVRGTRWAALNAVSEYTDWLREPRSPEAQLTAIWDGVAYRTKAKALSLLKAA
jgi:phage/plasmid-like protein (TIGR03299 family)